MKRLAVLFFLLCCLCFNARAQWLLGGGLSFGSTSGNRFSINIAPEVGYRVSDTFAFGGRLSYYSANNQFGVDPYARLDMLKPESPVRVLLYAHAPFVFASQYFSYGVYLQPGASIAMGGNARFEIRVGSFGWGTVLSSGRVVSSGWSANISFSDIALGVVFSL